MFSRTYVNQLFHRAVMKLHARLQRAGVEDPTEAILAWIEEERRLPTASRPAVLAKAHKVPVVSDVPRVHVPGDWHVWIAHIGRVALKKKVKHFVSARRIQRGHQKMIAIDGFYNMAGALGWSGPPQAVKKA